MQNPKRKNEHDSQQRRFIDAAREMGADEDEAAFTAKLAAIARQTVAPEKTEAAPQKKRPLP